MIETNFLVQQYNLKRIDDHLLKVIWIFFLAFVSNYFEIYRYSKLIVLMWDYVKL